MYFLHFYFSLSYILLRQCRSEADREQPTVPSKGNLKKNAAIIIGTVY